VFSAKQIPSARTFVQLGIYRLVQRTAPTSPTVNPINDSRHFHQFVRSRIE
jgi:hypothetical protein